jgi:heterodisulfide reductase subunit A-like polyferredoxin
MASEHEVRFDHTPARYTEGIMRQTSAYDEEVRDFSPPSCANENLSCQFLVTGGGLSGLSAAETARRRGLDVVVIEKGLFGKDGASGLNAGQF